MALRLRARTRLLLGAAVTGWSLLAAGCGSRTGLLAEALRGPSDDDVDEGGTTATSGGSPIARAGAPNGGNSLGGTLVGGGGTTGGTGLGGASMAGSQADAGAAGASVGGNLGAGGAPTAGDGGAASCADPCTTAPAQSCVSDKTLRRYHAPGSCNDGACSFDFVDATCLAGCEDAKCRSFPVLLSAGESSTCASVNDGPVKCWGANPGGQLGVDWMQQPTTPVEVTELGTGVRSVAVGNGDACAVTAGGAVKCWGAHYGTGVQNVPPLTSGVVALAAGAPYFDHVCALTDTGAVKCWGSNNFGQLGNDTTSPAFTYDYTVVDVVGLSSGVLGISAGSNNSCAITAGGGLKCWGMNWYGALGDGMLDQPSGPVDVVGLSSGVSRVASGELMSCVALATGGVKCWGWSVLVPTEVAGLSSGVSAVAVNTDACALTTAGGVKCWGTDNNFGVLGNGSTEPSALPGDVVGLTSGAVAISVGQHHACAALETGGIKCWGSNGNYRLGDGTNKSSYVPLDVTGF